MLHVEQIKWFGTKNTTSEYYSGIIKEEDWWYELCNLCCHHRMGWLLLSWWNRGRQIPIFKASRKVDVLVATKMNISSIEVHSLTRVWNGWEKANMNTCYFGCEQKPITPQTMTGTVERATKITAWERCTKCIQGGAPRLTPLKIGIVTLCYWLSRLRDCKSWRCGERSEGGAEDGAYRWKREKPSSCVGRKTKAYRKGWLGSVPLQ